MKTNHAWIIYQMHNRICKKVFILGFKFDARSKNSSPSYMSLKDSICKTILDTSPSEYIMPLPPEDSSTLVYVQVAVHPPPSPFKASSSDNTHHQPPLQRVAPIPSPSKSRHATNPSLSAPQLSHLLTYPRLITLAIAATTPWLNLRKLKYDKSESYTTKQPSRGHLREPIQDGQVTRKGNLNVSKMENLRGI